MKGTFWVLICLLGGLGCSPVLPEDCRTNADCPEGYVCNTAIQTCIRVDADLGASTQDAQEPTDGSLVDAQPARDAGPDVAPDATLPAVDAYIPPDARVEADGLPLDAALPPSDAVIPPPEDASPPDTALIDAMPLDVSAPLDAGMPDAALAPDATAPDAGCSEGDHCIEQCEPAPGGEVCNDLDDDCDGQIDDGVLNACGECGPVREEVCDGIDNDCDGAVDEGCPCSMDSYVRTNTTCGRGACLNFGQTSCLDGAIVDSCQFDPPVTADDFTCDGIDDDCDGTADDDFVASRSTCGIGACARTGQLQCHDAEIVDTCQPGSIAPEICGNHVDDDCDNFIDEAGCVPPAPDPDAGILDAAPPVDAALPPPDAAPPPMDAALPVDSEVVDASPGDAQALDAGTPDAATSPEVCDGIDNDRNGQIDDGLFQDCANACGQGGVEVCVNGAFVGCNAPILVEICDAVDNDCDGRINEDQSAGTCFCKDQDRDGHPDCDVSNGNIGDSGWRYEIPAEGISANDCRDDRADVWLPGSPRCGD